MFIYDKQKKHYFLTIGDLNRPHIFDNVLAYSKNETQDTDTDLHILLKDIFNNDWIAGEWNEGNVRIMDLYYDDTWNGNLHYELKNGESNRYDKSLHKLYINKPEHFIKIMQLALKHGKVFKGLHIKSNAKGGFFVKLSDEYKLFKNFADYNAKKIKLLQIEDNEVESAWFTFHRALDFIEMLNYLSIYPVFEWFSKKAKEYEPKGIKNTIVNLVCLALASLSFVAEIPFYIIRNILSGIAFGIAAALSDTITLYDKYILKPVLERQIKTLEEAIEQNPVYKEKSAMIFNQGVNDQAEVNARRQARTNSFVDDYVEREVRRHRGEIDSPSL